MLLQIVVLRESFLLFAGNELSMALILGLWLILSGLGGLAGTRLPDRAAPWLLALLPAAGIWTVAALRGVPPLLPVPVGAEIPLGWAVPILAAALAPLNLSAGALFPTGCRFFAVDEASDIGRFYRLEALGAAAAGAVFTFFLAGRLRGVDLAVWAAGAAGLSAAWALRPHAAAPRITALALGIAALGAGPFLKLADKADALWWGRRLPMSARLATAETPYHRLDLGRLAGQLTVYVNGEPAFSLHDTQEAFAGYRLADLYMSLRPEALTVFVIGGGEPGLFRRLSEYPLRSVVYALPDRSLTRWSDPAAEGADAYRIVEGCGRTWLRGSKRTFDLIILDLPPPGTAAAGRFFTSQAFQEYKAALAEDGLLAFRLPSSSHYLAGDTELLLASIHRAFLRAFPSGEILSGDSMVFLGSAGPRKASPRKAAEAFAARSPPLRLPGRVVDSPADKRLFFAALYEDLFDARRREDQAGAMRSLDAPVNDDSRPAAFLIALKRWLRESPGSPLRAGLSAAEAGVRALARRPALPILTAAALLGLWLAGLRRRPSTTTRRRVLAACLFISGWTAMAVELAVLFLYQSRFGDLYRSMGALFATYMLGLAAGGFLAAGRLRTPEKRTRGLLGARAFMAFICAGAAGLASLDAQWPFYLTLFAFASALGFEFPAAAETYRREEGGHGAAGILHGSDNLGAGAATLAAGVLLLPLLGPRALLLTAALLHLAALAALAAALMRKHS